MEKLEVSCSFSHARARVAGLGSSIQQFLEIEAISKFQRQHFFSQPFFTLCVFQYLVLELLHGVRGSKRSQA